METSLPQSGSRFSARKEFWTRFYLSKQTVYPQLQLDFTGGRWSAEEESAVRMKDLRSHLCDSPNVHLWFSPCLMDYKSVTTFLLQ